MQHGLERHPGQLAHALPWPQVRAVPETGCSGSRRMVDRLSQICELISPKTSGNPMLGALHFGVYHLWLKHVKLLVVLVLHAMCVISNCTTQCAVDFASPMSTLCLTLCLFGLQHKGELDRVRPFAGGMLSGTTRNRPCTLLYKS